MKGKKIKQAPGGIHSIIDQYNNLHVTYIEDVEKMLHATYYYRYRYYYLIVIGTSTPTRRFRLPMTDEFLISTEPTHYNRYSMYIVRVSVYYSFGFSAFFSFFIGNRYVCQSGVRGGRMDGYKQFFRFFFAVL